MNPTLGAGGSVYTAVPKPAAVAKLPHVGLMPVPAITEYTVDGEDPKWGNRFAEDGPVIDCRCELGVGRPVIGKQCPVRQRESMTRRLCNVCRQRVSGLAVFVGVKVSVEMPDTAGPVPVSMEAPTHPECAAYSALVCPAIGAEHASRCALALTSRDYPMVDRWVVADPDRPGRAKEKFMPHGSSRLFLGRPIGALDFVFARLDTKAMRFCTLAEWMPVAAPQPYRRLWLERAGAAA